MEGLTHGVSVEELVTAGDTVAVRINAALADVPITAWGLARDGEDRLHEVVSKLDTSERIGLLLAAVERMPELRAARDERMGALMYQVASMLYRSKLPLGEAELGHLLRAARHDCGHGADTRPPFDLTRRYLRENGYSPTLGAALREFVRNLPNSRAVKVQALRRSAALFAVLDRDLSDVRGAPASWWINEVRRSLTAIEPSERQAWERLVLSITVSEQMAPPSSWRNQVRTVLDNLGPDLVGRRLVEWWPKPPTVSLHGSGAQLLKHFIWMLEELPRPEGEHLVCLLAQLTWTPRPRPFAVLKPAAAYLASATSPEAVDARSYFLSQIASESPNAVA